ncbi:phosphoserine phosphatase SerB [Halohasta salina]|uniref:phosphoserine phosphatase SerB n=1 Tax=Halohasta salina TaxID=2961621 RepID=UPI0020A5FAAE|nr:phosphoserine phosphatase SerB [Halohasta salina]
MSLIAFDFDGTLSDSEMTVLLGEKLGVDDEMAEITERAMNNELSYAESLRSRADLITGLSEEDAEDAYSQVELRPDAAALIDRLREAGHTVAIFTGGFERGVQRALEADDTAVDMIVSNRLPIEDGELTGEVEGPLIEGTKDDQLEELAGELGVDMADTIAVGDGANDLPMLEVAGLAVGFEPKPAVEPSCDEVVSTMADLGTLLESRGMLAAAVDD